LNPCGRARCQRQAVSDDGLDNERRAGCAGASDKDPTPRGLADFGAMFYRQRCGSVGALPPGQAPALRRARRGGLPPREWSGERNSAPDGDDGWELVSSDYCAE